MSAPAAANVAADLPAIAAREPDGLAVRVARRRGGELAFEELRWAELDRRSDAIAAGLLERGLEPGDRACLFVRPGLDLVACVFALFKAGVVPVLLDPGMGRRRLLASIARMRPRAFVGIPLAHAARRLFPAAFESVELPVTVGPRWFWRGPTLAEVEARHDGRPVLADGDPDRTAAILFTSGSTGPPKGVVYTHANFLAQIRALRALYGFRPGEVDLACFPLFALFCPALGTTAVFPELDPVRPRAATRPRSSRRSSARRRRRPSARPPSGAASRRGASRAAAPCRG